MWDVQWPSGDLEGPSGPERPISFYGPHSQPCGPMGVCLRLPQKLMESFPTHFG